MPGLALFWVPFGEGCLNSIGTNCRCTKERPVDLSDYQGSSRLQTEPTDYRVNLGAMSETA